MIANQNITNSFTMLQQTQYNATSWIGHSNSDDKDIVSGQTFVSPKDCDLEAIEIFSSLVTNPGYVTMTLHQFDEQEKKWGPELKSTVVDFEKKDFEKWIAFHLNGIHLNKGKSYGFKLHCADSFIGIGEAVSDSQDPVLDSGQEWQCTNGEKKGQSLNYFSLAFKVDIRA